MRKNVLSIILIISLLCSFLFLPQLAHAQIPFGGQILGLTICDTGTLALLGPPVPGFYMWMPGTISYLNGPPIHPGQWLLGMAGPPMVCVVGLVPVGAGLIILFHGSSI